MTPLPYLVFVEDTSRGVFAIHLVNPSGEAIARVLVVSSGYVSADSDLMVTSTMVEELEGPGPHAFVTIEQDTTDQFDYVIGYKVWVYTDNGGYAAELSLRTGAYEGHRPDAKKFTFAGLPAVLIFPAWQPDAVSVEARIQEWEKKDRRPFSLVNGQEKREGAQPDIKRLKGTVL